MWLIIINFSLLSNCLRFIPAFPDDAIKKDGAASHASVLGTRITPSKPSEIFRYRDFILRFLSYSRRCFSLSPDNVPFPLLFSVLDAQFIQDCRKQHNIATSLNFILHSLRSFLLQLADISMHHWLREFPAL